MKKNPEEIMLRKQIKKTFKNMFPEITPETPKLLLLKNPIPVKTNTSFVHNSGSGRWVMTVLCGPTAVIGVNPTMNSVIFNNKLTKTVRGKIDTNCTYQSRSVPLTTMPLQILRFIASEFCK